MDSRPKSLTRGSDRHVTVCPGDRRDSRLDVWTFYSYRGEWIVPLLIYYVSTPDSRVAGSQLGVLPS